MSEENSGNWVIICDCRKCGPAWVWRGRGLVRRVEGEQVRRFPSRESAKAWLDETDIARIYPRAYTVAHVGSLTYALQQELADG